MCLGGRAFVGCPGTAITGGCGSAVAFVCAIGAQRLGLCLIGSAIIGGCFCAAAIGMCDVRAALVEHVCAPSRGGCASAIGFVRGVGAASLEVGLIGCALVGGSCAVSGGRCLGGRAFVGCPGTAVTGVCGYAVAFVCAIGAQLLSVCLIGSAIIRGPFCAATIGMCGVRGALVARVCTPSIGWCSTAVGFVRRVGAASLAVGLIGCALVGGSCAVSGGMCLGGRAFVGCPGTAFDCVCGYAVAFVCAIGAQWLGMCLIGSAIVGGSLCAAAIGMCDVCAALVARVCAPSIGGCANGVGFVRGVGAASLEVGLIGCALVGGSCAVSCGMCRLRRQSAIAVVPAGV